jgi:chemotaxis protein MotB
MEENGLTGDQISEVRGYADRRLRNVKDPLDPSNRRISLIVQYLPQENPQAPALDEKPAENLKNEGGQPSAPSIPAHE